MIDKPHLWTPAPDRRRFLKISGGFLAAGALAACGSNNGRTDASSTSSASAVRAAFCRAPSSPAGSVVASSSAAGSSVRRVRRCPVQWAPRRARRPGRSLCPSGTTSTAKRAPSRRWRGTPRPTRRPNVTVQWTPGDYDTKLSSSLLTNSGPDVFEAEPEHRPDPGQPGRRPGRHHGRRARRLHRDAGAPNDLQGQDLRHPADHRHAAALYRKSLLQGAGVSRRRPSTTWSPPPRN